MNTSTQIDSDNKLLVGIGGWLLLPALGTFLAPIFLGIALYDSISLLNEITGDLIGIAVYDLLSQIVLMGISIWSLYLLVRADKKYPKVFSLLLLFSLTNALIGILLLTSYGAPANSLAVGFFRSLVAAAIWLPYIYRSKRVKLTFVN